MNDADMVREPLTIGSETPRRQLLHRLTKTERKVLSLMVEGLKNREIGERMFVSVNTVKTHVQHIFQKLAVSTREQAADVLKKFREEGKTSV